jgi:type VII secretion-associated serine protease mycosin
MVEVRREGRTVGHRLKGRSTVRRSSSVAIAAVLFGFPMLIAAPGQGYSSQQWALDYLKADSDWQITKGSGVTVAVIDSGVTSIPDLRGNLLSGADFTQGTSSSGNGEIDLQSDGHGTGMASVIAGNGTYVFGLASNAKILPVRTYIDTGNVPEEIAAGINYAISQHVGIINLSIGLLASVSSVRATIAAAVDANIVVVAATGNDSSQSISYPAAYPGVIAVTAIDQTGSFWSQSNAGAQVTLAAPGVNIYRDNNAGVQGTSSGTSEATAYVSAAAALVRSEHPDWTAGQVIRDLISTADPGPGQTAGQHSDQYGYGIVDPLNALQAAAPAATTNPLLASSGSVGNPTSPNNPAPRNTSPTDGHRSTTALIIGAVPVIVLLVLLFLVLRARFRRGGRV